MATSPTSGEVSSVFSKNAAAIDDRFIGKTVRVTGKVNKVERKNSPFYQHLIKKDSGENHYVLILLAEPADGNRKPLPLAFLFPVSSRKQLAELEEGQRTTIEGVCQGAVGPPFYVVFTKCQFVKGE
jgi:hypothetical protein